MLKNLSKLILLTIISAVSLNAELIFDIQEQYFANTLKGQYKPGTYDLPKTRVSTVGLTFTKSGTYIVAKNNSGAFIVKLKKPIKDFNVNLTSRYYSMGDQTYYEQSHSGSSSFIINSETGKKFVISINFDTVTVDGKEFKIGVLGNKNLTFVIQKSNGKIIASVNGQTLVKKDADSFGKLKRIECNFDGALYGRDQLIDLSVYGQ